MNLTQSTHIHALPSAWHALLKLTKCCPSGGREAGSSILSCRSHLRIGAWPPREREGPGGRARWRCSLSVPQSWSQLLKTLWRLRTSLSMEVRSRRLRPGVEEMVWIEGSLVPGRLSPFIGKSMSGNPPFLFLCKSARILVLCYGIPVNV